MCRYLLTYIVDWGTLSGMERISRRDFLKTSALALSVPFIPRSLTDKEALPPEPLTELPILYTSKTPLCIEHQSSYGTLIDYTIPGYEKYTPETIEVSGVPLDILPPIAPEPDLKIANPQGEVAWTAYLPHITYGRPSRIKAIVGWGDRNSIHQFNGSLYGKRDNFVSSYAFSDRLAIYPSKIYNDLTALALIALWHRDNDPFLPGKTYSYLEITKVVEKVFDDFVLGQAFWAGGICATASTISKCVFLAEKRGLTEIKERYLHQPEFQYAENPFDPGVTKKNSDATVAFLMNRPANYRYNSDFKFSLTPDSPPLFFSLAAQVYPSDNPAPLTDIRRHTRAPADARLIFSVNLVSRDPNFYENQALKLMAIRDRYAAFHGFDDLFALNEEQKK